MTELLETAAQLFFLPGDVVIWLLMRFTMIERATGVTHGMYGSFESGAISGLAWIAAFLTFIRTFKR